MVQRKQTRGLADPRPKTGAVGPKALMQDGDSWESGPE